MSAQKPYVRASAQPWGAPAAGRSVDELDERILGILLREGRASAREIGTRLHASTSTVTSRVERLRSRGVLRGFSADVDFQKLGYELTVVTEIRVSKGKLVEMERDIAKMPEVCAVYDVTGEVDAVVVSKCRNREDLSRFTKGLLAMPFIERTNTHVVLTTVKEDFRLPV